MTTGILVGCLLAIAAVFGPWPHSIWLLSQLRPKHDVAGGRPTGLTETRRD